jgi:small subunit ribosomal protein S11
MKAQISIKASFSNTFISLLDQNTNNVIYKLSAGCVAERSRRGSYFGAITTAIAFSKKVQSDFNIRKVNVFINGVGPGRDAALRGLKISGLKITSIVDKTRNPHNGCRSPKKRRI